MNKKSQVAILFGGRSVEHQISINSAKNIYQFIDKDKFDPVLIGISQEGKWFIKEEVDENFDKGDELLLVLDADNGAFYNKKTGEAIKPAIVFPILHGTDGEDGNIQGMLETIKLPFVGTGVLGSAISMSKLHSKRLLQSAGIPVSKFIAFEAYEKERINYNMLSEALGVPFMTKAANLGSSVGIHKVKSEEDFHKAVADVFHFDDTIIFEQFIEGRELECAIIGNEKPQASLPGEIVVSDNYEFYTYEAKYLDPEAAKLEIPAKVTDEIAHEIQMLSIKSYQTLNCEDFARVDLFLKKNGEIIINEINTIPGFTNSSMFPMMWKERGTSFTNLITLLIEMAQQRYEKRASISNQISR